MLKRTFLITLSLALTGIFFVLTSSVPAQAQEKVWPKSLRISSHHVGGGAYVAASTWAEMINKYVKGVDAQNVASTGTGANVARLRKGEVELIHLSSIVMWNAFRGIESEAKFGKTPVRWITQNVPLPFFLVARADTGIKKITDLKGKVVMYEQIGSPSSTEASLMFLKAYGMTPADFKVGLKWSTWTEEADLLKEKKIDAGFNGFVTPHPGLMQLCLEIPINIVGFDSKEDMKRAITAAPRWAALYTLPPGVYKGQDKEIYTAGQSAGYACHRDLPEGLVYELAAVLYNHLDECATYHPQFKYWTLEFAASSTHGAYHKGAIKYLREKGVWGPEEDARQAKLLAEIGEKY